MVDLRHPTDATTFPWQYAYVGEMSERVRELLEHARNFSEVMWGATLLYNLMLAEARAITPRVEEYRGRLEQWAAQVKVPARWSWDEKPEKIEAFGSFSLMTIVRGSGAVRDRTGAAGLTSLTRSARFVPMAAQRFQGHLALTIEIGGAPVGTLMINTHTPRRFLMDEAQLLGLLGSQLAPQILIRSGAGANWTGDSWWLFIVPPAWFALAQTSRYRWLI